MVTWGEVFNIFKRPKLSDEYNRELDNSREGLDHLIQLTIQLEKEESKRDKYINLLNATTDNLGLNVWVKDKNGAFIYINEPAAKNIFKTDVNAILHMKDDDFIEDELAQVCMNTDRITIDKDKPCRFIEHARYPSGSLWLDVTKNTLYIKDKFVGVQGTAKDITDIVPKDIRDHCAKSGSFEIDFNLEYYTNVDSGKRENDLTRVLEKYKEEC